MSENQLPTVYNLIRNGPHYRREAFVNGLQELGYKPLSTMNGRPKKGDILLIWNRYGEYENQAKLFESSGGIVIVVENGYSTTEKKHFALSLFQHHHGGVGVKDNNFDELNFSPGKHILVCAQRGIGSDLMRSPTSWDRRIASKLQRFTKREIKIRLHPGKHEPSMSLEKELKNCHACIVWSSACGVKALQLGVQTFYDAPRWICEKSARKVTEIISGDCDINMVYDANNSGLVNTFNNQWDLEQIASGQAFATLLGSYYNGT